MRDIQSLIKSFLDECIPDQPWYQNIKNEIKAIILYGSVAKGTNRPDSDIDLLFIMPLEVEEKYTAGEYVLNYEGQEFNIVMRSIERLRYIATGESDPFQAEIFRGSQIIWQKNDEVREIITKILNKTNKGL